MGEIAHQGDMITKLGKEKRSCADGRQKVEEDIQAAEDKCNHLSRVKGKLEQALDEAEDALEREKKVKGDVEKAKRKVEGDLKLTQEAFADLEPNSGRPSRSWRRSRSVPSLPPSSKPLRIRIQICQLKLEEKSDKILNQTLPQYPHNCEDTEVAK